MLQGKVNAMKGKTVSLTLFYGYCRSVPNQWRCSNSSEHYHVTDNEVNITEMEKKKQLTLWKDKRCILLVAKNLKHHTSGCESHVSCWCMWSVSVVLYLTDGGCGGRKEKWMERAVNSASTLPLPLANLPSSLAASLLHLRALPLQLVSTGWGVNRNEMEDKREKDVYFLLVCVYIYRVEWVTWTHGVKWTPPSKINLGRRGSVIYLSLDVPARRHTHASVQAAVILPCLFGEESTLSFFSGADAIWRR